MPTGPACVPSGGVCTSSSDCCPGGACDIANGGLQGTCHATTPPPPVDGGQPPPVCATTGQTCAKTADCCNGGSCLTLAGAACAAGLTGCTCHYVIQ
jgi:hypothetical protein